MKSDHVICRVYKKYHTPIFSPAISFQNKIVGFFKPMSYTVCNVYYLRHFKKKPHVIYSTIHY